MAEKEDLAVLQPGVFSSTDRLCSRTAIPGCGGSREPPPGRYSGRAPAKKMAARGEFLLLSGVFGRPADEILIYRPGFGEFSLSTLPVDLDPDDVEIHFGQSESEIFVATRSALSLFFLGPAQKMTKMSSFRPVEAAVELPLAPGPYCRRYSRVADRRVYILTQPIVQNPQPSLTILSYGEDCVFDPKIVWTLCSGSDGGKIPDGQLDFERDGRLYPERGEVLSFDVASNGQLVLLRTAGRRVRELVWFDLEKWEELFSVQLRPSFDQFTPSFDLVVIDALDQVMVRNIRLRPGVKGGLEANYTVFSPDGRQKTEVLIENKSVRYPCHESRDYRMPEEENILSAGFDGRLGVPIFYDRPERLISRFNRIL